MAEIITERFSNIYQLLNDHNFENNRNIPEGLKCNKCKKLLVNACQVTCGCLFCRNCINEMLENGSLVCPGNTEFCKEQSLSNYQTDHRININILRLVVKCPEDLCPHECELINMEEHLRLCSNKCAKCPFSRFGCDNNNLVTSKMCDHLQLECYNHNRILIELIDNLRNEVNVLKISDQKQKTNSILKDERIALMNEEIQRNKTQIEILKENATLKSDEITIMNEEIDKNKNQIKAILKENSCMKDETIAEINEEIRLIKQEVERKSKHIIVGRNRESNDDKTEPKKMKNIDLLQQMKTLEMKIDKKIQEKCGQEKQEYEDNLRREVNKLNDEMQNFQIQLTIRINELDRWLDKQIDGSFVWKINQVSDERKKYEYIYSTIFYPKINPYKMQLRMRNDSGSDQLLIRLLIMNGEKDMHIKWPYQGNVTIKILNKTKTDAFQNITKNCIITKPNINSYNLSEVFKFSYNELSTSGLMQDDYFIIECCVE